MERYDLGLFRSILQVLANPNIAFLLLILGALGLLYELAAPGVGFGGATGAIALLLALFSLSVLPVSVVGLALLAVAIVLFVAELLAPGVAGFALAGAVVLVLSAVFLFDAGQGVSVDLAVVLPSAIVVAAAAEVDRRPARGTYSEAAVRQHGHGRLHGSVGDGSRSRRDHRIGLHRRRMVVAAERRPSPGTR